MRLLTVLLALFLPAAALAADEPKPTHWWDITAGILAIPATLVGFVVTYATLKKLRLESTKLELEILEKQNLIATAGDTASPEARLVAKSLMEPLADNNKVNYLILRFVVIFLILQFWEIFQKLFGLAVGSTIITLQKVFHLSTEGFAGMIVFVGGQIVQLSWIALVILFGVPLYRDISSHIGFTIFKRSRAPRGSPDRTN